jgi:glycosyltransferase involved in cell wall biosynthesis
MAGRLDFHRYDIIHAHSDDFLLPHKNCPPVIRTLHGSCLMEAMHIPGMREKFRMLFLAATETFSARRASKAVCISAHTHRFFPWTTDIIPPGVDPLLFHPPSISQRESAILFVGTFHWRKRGKLLADIYTDYIRPKHPEVQLWMVCEDAPKREGVVIYQRIPTDSLAELYRKSMLFCLPSSYEGFGVPYAEALSCGVPVVATPNAGANEVLENGKWGVIAPANILADELLMLIENRSKRERLGHQGTIRAANYHWPGVIARYEKVYNSVLAD